MPQHQSLFHKIKNELIKIWALSFYFALFFIAISFFRYAVLEHANVPYTTFALGVVNSIICAKFLMISQAIYPLRLRSGQALVWPILSRSLTYVVLVTVLVASEEFVVDLANGRLAQS